jgi:hypothetical protein
MALPALMRVTIKISHVVNLPTAWFNRSMPLDSFNKDDIRTPKNLRDCKSVLGGTRIKSPKTQVDIFDVGMKAFQTFGPIPFKRLSHALKT